MDEPEPVRANFQSSYQRRYLLLAGVCMFMAAWFAYDGLIGYPSKLPAARAYDAIRDLDSAERSERWREIAEQNGWPRRVPDKSAETIESDITGQYFWALLNLALGLPALVLYIRSRGAWIESTAEGLITSRGERVDFADVRRLDKKKWATKGMARATYVRDGVERTFVFDDFKYDREPIGKMLRALEDALSPEQIVGGPSENQRDAEAAT